MQQKEFSGKNNHQPGQQMQTTAKKDSWLKTHVIVVVIAAMVLVALAMGGIWLASILNKKTFSTQEDYVLSTTTLTGKVVIPEGMAIKEGDIQVSTMLDAKTATGDGNFSLTGFDAGRQLAMTTTKKGHTIFMGFIDAKNQEISSKTTAEVLLFQASGAMYLPYSAWPEALNVIHAFAFGDNLLPKKIEEIASQDPEYLTNGNKELLFQIEEALQRLKNKQFKSSVFQKLFALPVAEAKPDSGIDTEEKSGIRIDPGTFNDVKVTNKYRRIIRANFYEIGFKKNGTYIALPSPKFVASTDAPTVGKLTDLAATVYDLLVGKVHYAEQSSPAVMLASEDSQADATVYKVIALGWGRWHNASDATWQPTKRDNSDLQEITITTAFQEIVFPIFMMGISTDKAQQIFDDESAVAFIKETSRFLLSDSRADNEGWKAILEKLMAGDFKGGVANVMEFLAKSETLQQKVSSWIVGKVSVKFGETVAAQFLSKMTGVFAKPVQTVNLVLKGFDATLLVASFNESNQREEWEITVRPVKITLDPQSVEVNTDDLVDFKVEVQSGEQKTNPDTGEVKINLTYEWYHKNKKMGEFKDKTGDVYVSTKNTATYIVKDDRRGDDTVEVKVYWLRNTGPKNERIYLGSKSAKIVKSKSGDLDTFAKCLKNKGVKLYSAHWCSHCQNQIALFGTSAKFLPVVECFAPGDNIVATLLPVCGAKKIVGYPMWEFSDGSRLSGLQQPETISKKSGCKL